MPTVANAVSIFISPVFAIAPARNVKVPLLSVKKLALDALFDAYTKSLSSMRALLERLNAVPSVKVMPALAFGPVCTMSP